uniref:Uncharacterized protein n=1 Tax=Anguilla anguilla TaxID=7936 RepID=A0A0E9QEQ7_ANGAN
MNQFVGYALNFPGTYGIVKK